MNNTKCRLINPTKSELGRVSKQMLAKIISTVKSKSQLQQWKNTHSVIEWFTKLENKEKHYFIQFDVVDYYASITPELIKKSIEYAERFVKISDEEKDTIFQACNSFLCNEGKDWIKKQGKTFDITMGGFHGAEICDLAGLYLLSLLKEVLPNVGLYRDDGLAVSSATCRQIELMKKRICKIFENNGLKVTIEANAKQVNFLDVTLDLTNGIYKPYMKENNVPLYVHVKSNHPPKVIQNIPMGINRRLNSISASKDVFESAAPEYQEALTKSGYNYHLAHDQPSNCSTRKKNRRRNITWFNPPFSINVKTNVGKEFLKLIDTAFPTSNPLHKLFTRQTLKISYKCMAQAISRHNAQLLKEDQPLASLLPSNLKAGMA